MSNFSQTHPAMAAKIADLIEFGYDPEQIIAQFRQDDETKRLKDLEGGTASSEEVFPDEIMIISQALAYRALVVENDLLEIHSLLSAAYQPEVGGEESFRIGDSIDINSIVELMRDSCYQWLVVEAPSGRGIEQDGVILGVACFNTDGYFRASDTVRENLGSIRYLAVLPRYQGFCLGRRLLERVEHTIFSSSCSKIMVCVPSCRLSIVEWMQRRGYDAYGEVKYPAAGVRHILKDSCQDVVLVRFLKDKSDVLIGAAPAISTTSSRRPVRDKLGRVVGTSNCVDEFKSSEGTTALGLVVSDCDEADTYGVD